MKFLKKEEITVIYDACYSLSSRGWLWYDIFDQLVKRVGDTVEIAVAYLDHEAGIMFPEIALSATKEANSHWKAVNKTCESFVDWRKGMIRPLLISQLESEIIHRIRDKCIAKAHKKGVLSKRYPEPLVRAVARQRVDEYSLSLARELYTRGNTMPKFKEISHVWKMVPQVEVTYGQSNIEEEANGHKERNRLIKELVAIGKLTLEEIGGLFGLSHQRISRISRKQ